ncbi:MAG: hypothetical protein JXO51_06825, partial [Candidatus Aminicenantes bacterium]|nr:hypothetical protein [Candidatus Aminicenantes bacterium]
MPKLKSIAVEGVFIAAPPLLALAIFRLIRAFPLQPYVSILGSILSLALVASLFLKLDFKWLVLLRATGVGLLYLFWLKDVPFNFEGMFGDNHYYTLAIEKFYYAFLPWSHEYHGIHFSLPPLFFFVIGRVGALLGVALPDLLKYSAFLFVIYLPYVWGYFLGGVFKKDKWLAAFILSLLVAFKNPLPEYSSLAFLAQKGWRFLGMFLILVWYMWLKRKRPHFLKAGLAAGVLFALDFSPLLFISMAIAYDLIASGVAALRNRAGLAKLVRDLGAGMFYYLRLGIVALLLNAVWLVPVVRDLLTHRLGTSFNNFFAASEGHASILQSFALLDPFDLLSIALLVGLANLFLNLTRRGEVDSLRSALLGLLAFILVFYVLNFLGTPIPMQHVSLFILHILALAAVFLAVRFQGQVLLRLALALLVLFSVSRLNENRQNPYALNLARKSAAIHARGEALRREHDLFGKVVFPTTNELFFGKNTYSFITADFFSDAAASFDDRLAYIQETYRRSRTEGPAALHRDLKRTPFGAVHFLLLERDGEGELLFSVNAYHNDLKEFRSKRRFFRFRRGDFPEPYFREIYS